MTLKPPSWALTRRCLRPANMHHARLMRRKRGTGGLPGLLAYPPWSGQLPSPYFAVTLTLAVATMTESTFTVTAIGYFPPRVRFDGVVRSAWNRCLVRL